jgi:hypothetical protein
MIQLLLLYCLCFISGFALEQKLLLNRLLLRLICGLSLGACQLLCSIQMVSPFSALTPAGLLIANLGLTVCLLGFASLFPRQPSRKPWRELLVQFWNETRVSADPLSFVMIVVAVLAMLIQSTLGALAQPIGDIYHFEMPLYWTENQSIRPFPVENPRVGAVAFAGEALALPGYVCMHSGIMFFIITLIAAALTLGVIFSTSRALGFSFPASLCAAALPLGFTDFGQTFISIRAGAYLACLWAAGAVLFLLEAKHETGSNTQRFTFLGCSAFCMALCCGAKNSMMLLLPVYVLAAAWAFRRELLQIRILGVLAGMGLMGLICSGVAWNYVHNLSWYGSLQGPPFLRTFSSHDFHPRAAWTRIVRGGVLLCADTIWVPKKVRSAYVKVVQTAASLLGAQPRLAEDNDIFNFEPASIGPTKGLGLVGILFFLPALGVAMWRSASFFKPIESQQKRCDTAVVLIMTIGAFVMCHLAFRWQWLGVLRLMPAFGVLGAPLCAALLESKWCRSIALVLMLASCGMFLMLNLSVVCRRIPVLGNSPVGHFVSRFTNEHTLPAEYSGTDGIPHPMIIRENYTQREVIRKFLAGIPQPAKIGFVGHESFEAYYLFGRKFSNRVIPLVDSRFPDRILDPPTGIQYVVVGLPTPKTDQWATAHHLVQVFQATAEGTCLLKAFAPAQAR